MLNLSHFASYFVMTNLFINLLISLGQTYLCYTDIFHTSNDLNVHDHDC